MRAAFAARPIAIVVRPAPQPASRTRASFPETDRPSSTALVARRLADKEVAGEEGSAQECEQDGEAPVRRRGPLNTTAIARATSAAIHGPFVQAGAQPKSKASGLRPPRSPADRRDRRSPAVT